MDEIRYPIVFLDTNVLISAFTRYRKGQRLPFYLTDSKANRFTFEKCIFEAYMIFRGITKESAKDTRGDAKRWADKYLDKESDARPLDVLINKYHKSRNKPNDFEGNYWINNIEGNEELVDFYENLLKEQSYISQNDLVRKIQVLKGLIRNRCLFEKLCDEFRKMLSHCNVRTLSYHEVFGIRENGLLDTDTRDLLVTLDNLSRTTIIPSEDFEIVCAAMRL